MIQFCSLIARNKVGLAVDYSDKSLFTQQIGRKSAGRSKAKPQNAPAALPDRASPASTNSLSIPRPFCYTIWPYRSRPRTCAAVIVSSSFVKSPEKSFQELLT
jgi:hypothetical protein